MKSVSNSFEGWEVKVMVLMSHTGIFIVEYREAKRKPTLENLLLKH